MGFSILLKDILTCRLQGQESNHRPSDWWPTSLPPETQPPCACGKHRQTLDPSCRAFLNILTSSWPHQQIDAADWSLTGLFRSQHSQIQEVTVGEETNEGRKKKKGGPLGAEAAAQQDPYMVPSLSV